MTEKLYYDQTKKFCEAKVLACREGKEGPEVLLDRTVIYPEGGGQLSDTGRIDSAEVSYAFEEGEDIWNRCSRAFAPGEIVRVEFNEAGRLDHSQQHTGEHMLSGIAAGMFGCANVGFHMAEDYVSVDFDKQLSDEEVRALELAVNEAIERNERTVCRIVTEEEYETVELRKKAKGLRGDIRIVYAGGVDSCTCCGTHCENAGEVGLLRISSHANYKGGTRIWFNCGMRAMRSMIKDREMVDAVARRFSTKPEEAMKALIAQGDELSSLRRTLKARTEELFAFKAAELMASAPEYSGVKLIVASFEGYDMHELGLMAGALCGAGKCVAVLFSSSGGKLVYRLARSEGTKLSMKEVCAAVNGMVNGKGGGRDDGAQGSAEERSELKEICAQLENYLKNRLLCP